MLSLFPQFGPKFHCLGGLVDSPPQGHDHILKTKQNLTLVIVLTGHI